MSYCLNDQFILLRLFSGCVDVTLATHAKKKNVKDSGHLDSRTISHFRVDIKKVFSVLFGVGRIVKLMRFVIASHQILVLVTATVLMVNVPVKLGFQVKIVKFQYAMVLLAVDMGLAKSIKILDRPCVFVNLDTLVLIA